MIEKVKNELNELLPQYKNKTALYLSGGSDSLLLLHILLDLKFPFAIVTFNSGFTKEQNKYLDAIIYSYNLMVFSYPPSNRYLVGKGNQVAFVEEYPFIDGSTRAFIRDCEQSDYHCIYDSVHDSGNCAFPPVGFELNLFGIRKTDKHFLTGKICKEKTSTSGKFVYHNPLWDFSRKNVREGLKQFPQILPAKVETGTSPLCLKCFSDQPQVCPKTKELVTPNRWNLDSNFEIFRKRFVG